MLKKSLTSLFTQVIIYLAGIIGGILTARIFGPSGKGAYYLVVLASTAIFIITKANLDTASVYLANSKKLDQKVLVSTLLTLALTVSVLGVGLFLLFYKFYGERFFPGLPLPLILLGLLSLPFNLAILYLSGVFWSENEIIKINILQASQPILNIIGLIIAIKFLHAGVNGAVYSYLISFVITFIIASSLTIKKFGLFRPSFSVDIAKMLYAYGLKIHVGEILDFFINRMDSFAISYYLGAVAVGYYSVSVNAEVLWFLPVSIGFAIYPTVSSLSLENSRVFTQKVNRIVLFLSVCLAVFGVLLARPLVRIIYGDAFLPALTPLLLLLPGITILGIAKILKAYLNGKNHPWVATIASSIAIVVDVILIVTLTPRYGLAGAAISTSIGYIIYASVVLIKFTKVTNSNILDTLIIKKGDFSSYFGIIKKRLKLYG